jgi:two-component system, OmpR family, alkaline phosphatase synthesis response regulator PhoP
MLGEATAYKYRILCTEDDADTREVLRLLLEIDGFEVTCAKDSKQALSFAKAERFDLYLLDNRLADELGDVLCRKLREFDSTTPILFYSGAASPADKARAIAAGAQGYVIKPAGPGVLIAEIRRLLEC